MPALVLPHLSAAASVRAAARAHGDDGLPACSPAVAGLADDEPPGWVEGLLADVRGHAPRPDRRHGHATATLGAALPVAAQTGLERLLVTCDSDDVASRRVIERHGGLLQDQRGSELRSWVPTS